MAGVLCAGDAAALATDLAGSAYRISSAAVAGSAYHIGSTDPAGWRFATEISIQAAREVEIVRCAKSGSADRGTTCPTRVRCTSSVRGPSRDGGDTQRTAS